LAIKSVVISDIGGSELADGQVAKIKVSGHPALGQRVVELDVGTDEAKKFEDSASEFVYLEVEVPGSAPQEVFLDVSTFEKAFGTKADVKDILTGARDYSKPGRQSRRRRSSPGAGNGGEKLNYASVEHCAQLHRGRITDREKDLVTENLPRASANREMQTGKPINWDDPKERARYGLDD
jgi:hypothetical protein